jgi:hypothetical protein
MPAAPPIILTAFTGEQPRILPRLMPETAAQSARDVRLDDGGLTPMRQPSLDVAVTGSINWKTIYKYNNAWIGWDNVVHAAPGPIAEDRLYYTGDGKPKIRIGAQVYDLGIARPTGALVCSPAGGSGDVTTRVYSYTFVSALGEESEPAPASLPVNWMPGMTVTLSGFAAPPTDPAPTSVRFPYKQRIYRSQSGQSGTGLYLIAERTASNGNYADNNAVSAIAEPCPSVTWSAPPDDLEGLIVLPNGMMAAFGGAVPIGGKKKKLYFCEPYRPHAWPEKYSLTFEHEVMGLGAMAMAIIVATDAHPYMVSGTLPENMTSQKIEQLLPCINKRSVVDLGYAVAWGSNEGIVMATATGAINIASNAIFNRDGWLELRPQQMIAAQINGRYVAFYDYFPQDEVEEKGALLLDLANPNFLIRSDIFARAAVYSVEDSALYYAPVGVAEIWRFDSPFARRKRLYWKSKEFVLPYSENYGAIVIDTLDDFLPLDQEAEDAEEEERQETNLDWIQDQYPSGEYISLDGDLASTPIGYGYLAPITTPPAEVRAEQFINVAPLASDKLLPMPRRSGGAQTLIGAFAQTAAAVPSSLPKAEGGTLTVGVWADKKLVAAIGVANKAVRLPSGFKARTWEIDVLTDQRIDRITMAKTMDDLKRQP